MPVAKQKPATTEFSTYQEEIHDFVFNDMKLPEGQKGEMVQGDFATYDREIAIDALAQVYRPDSLRVSYDETKGVLHIAFK